MSFTLFSRMDLAAINTTHPALKAVTKQWRTSGRACLTGVLFCAGAAALAVPSSAGAQDAGRMLLAQAKAAGDSKKSIKTMDGKEIDIDEARRLFEEHQRKLKEAQQEKSSLESDTKALEAERTALQARLLQAAQKGQQAEKRLNAIEGEMERLGKREIVVRAALNESRATVAQMLGVMQRMGREPPPVMITERNDALKMVRSMMILSAFFPGFKAKADKLSAQLADLDDIIAKSRSERNRLAEAQAEAARIRAETDTLLAQKREKMQKNQARVEDIKVAAARHSRAVTDLGDLLQRLDGEGARQSTMAAYEAELKQLGPAVELKPDAKQVAFVQPGRMKPAIPFDKAKGLLLMPCQGKRLHGFGGQGETGAKSEGVRLEARHEAQIISPSDGWVIYAGQFRSYGQLLIINAGGGYHILLAGMDQIYTTVGQFVLAGEPVAAMGKAPPQSGDSLETRKPVLYIEFRKDARPVDPDPWWSEGVKEG